MPAQEPASLNGAVKPSAIWAVFLLVSNKLKDISQKIINPTDKATYIISAISRIVRSLSHIIINLFELTHDVLRAVPWIANIMLIFSSIIKVVNTLAATSETLPSRGAKLAASVLRIGFGVASITFMCLALFKLILPIIVATIATEIVLNTFLIGESLYGRFFGAWKKEKNACVTLKNEMTATYQSYIVTKKALDTLRINTPDDIIQQQKLSQECEQLKEKTITIHTRINTIKNRERERYRDIADKAHFTLIAAASLTGAALLLTPAAIIGAGILIGAACYSIMIKLDINPIRWLYTKVFGDPFQTKPASTDFNTIAGHIKKNTHDITPEAARKYSTSQMFQSLDISGHEKKNIDNEKIPVTTIEPEALPKTVNVDSFQPSLNPRQGYSMDL